jgi:hypothetical protein
VLQRLEFPNSSKLGIWREEGEVQQPMKRKRCNTENNIIDASPGPVARARLSLGEDSSFISNHRQLLPSIRITIDDVETTNSENVFENVGLVCLCV